MYTLTKGVAVIGLRQFVLLKMDPLDDRLVVDRALHGRGTVTPIGANAAAGFVTGQSVQIVSEGRNYFRKLKELPREVAA